MSAGARIGPDPGDSPAPRLSLADRREEFRKQLLAAFQMEAEEHLQHLSEGLLQLDSPASEEARGTWVESVYRAAHSLKGASRAVGLRDAEILCQAMESVLAGFKRGTLQPTTTLIDLLLASRGLIKQIIDAKGNPAPDVLLQIGPLLSEMEKGAEGKPVKAPAPAPDRTDADAQPEISANQVLKDSLETDSRVKPDTESGLNETADDQSAPKTVMPDLPPMAPPIEDQERPVAATPAPSVVPAADVAGPASAATQHIRVDSAHLDHVFRQAEELVALRLSLEHRVSQVTELHESITNWRRSWKRLGPPQRELLKRLEAEREAKSASAAQMRQMDELFKSLECQPTRLAALEGKLRELRFLVEQDRRVLGLHLDGLRGSIRRTLMLPFSQLTSSFPLMVRQIARELGKRVDFRIEGDQIEVEKRILEGMKDPLLHLIRNALDHGLETPEDRFASHKPETGNLQLLIEQAGAGLIELKLADDGRGIDLARLRAKALSMGLISSDQAEMLTADQTLELIFQSGISTRDEVSTLSGRGLGMAIVREKIQALGGHIRMENAPGIGMTFRLLLPATLASTRGVLVRAGNEEFCIPSSQVERVLRVKRAELQTIEGHPTVAWAGRRIACVNLATMLGLAPSNSRPADSKQMVALLIHAGNDWLALEIDELEGEQELLVKSLGTQVHHLRFIAGLTILGNGNLVPILHIPDLISAGSSDYARDRVPNIGAHKESLPVRILVADDSITTRMLIKHVLEDAGHEITTANDGVQALEILRERSFDLLMTDVEMPRMTGFELCRAVRSEPALKELPVILCTSLGSEEDKRQGMDAGANAYIVKRDFEQDNLLEIVTQLAGRES